MKNTDRIFAGIFVVLSFVATMVNNSMAIPAALAGVTYAILSTME